MTQVHFLTIKEYAARARRSPASANRDVTRGRVPTVRIGGRVLIPVSFFDDLQKAAYLDLAAEKEISDAK